MRYYLESDAKQRLLHKQLQIYFLSSSVSVFHVALGRVPQNGKAVDFPLISK